MSRQTPVQTFSYGGLRGLYSDQRPDLGGNVDQGDPYTHAPSVWDYVVHRFAVHSVLDVGCGQGHAAAYFLRAHGCAVTAIDGLASNLERAVYPIVIHDLCGGPFLTRVDLVYCAEVVEHIRADYVDNVLQTLACGRLVLMTHAVPNQAGYHHVNCQPVEYWIERLASYDFVLSDIDTRQIRRLAERDGAQHFASHGLMFIKTS